MKKAFSVILIFALAACLFSACAGGGADAPGSASPSESPSGETAGALADFTASDIDGNPIDESIFEGFDVIMFNVWATSCGPCLRELPDLGRLSSDYADKGVRIVGVVSDVLGSDGEPDESQRSYAKKIIESSGADYLHILPSADLAAAFYGDVYAVPTTVFCDGSGNIIGSTEVGSKSYDRWAALIDKLLAE